MASLPGDSIRFQLQQLVAQLAEDAEFADYLQMRADALLSDDYRPSDMAWMSMKNNAVELVIGPIENYEDQLYGYRAAHEAYVLIRGGGQAAITILNAAFTALVAWFHRTTGCSRAKRALSLTVVGNFGYFGSRF
jgi:hypothetical protein